MRKTALLLLLCFSLVTVAQQTSRQQPGSSPQAQPSTQDQQPESVPPPEGTTYSSVGDPAYTPTPTSRTHPMYPAVSPDMLKAPEPGHPLDMRDVDTLTGKNKPQYAPPAAAYYYGAPGYGYPGGYGFYPYAGAGPMPSFTTSGLLPSASLHHRPLPMLFGVFNGRPFFVAGNTTLATANPFNPFFFGRGFTPFAPVAPVFTFGNFSRTPQYGRQQPFGGRSSTATRPATTKRAQPKR